MGEIPTKAPLEPMMSVNSLKILVAISPFIAIEFGIFFSHLDLFEFVTATVFGISEAGEP